MFTYIIIIVFLYILRKIILNTQDKKNDFETPFTKILGPPLPVLVPHNN
jgi:hypothetical protein